MVKPSIFMFCAFVALRFTNAEDELLAVSLLYRHGDRAPTHFYPNDPYQDPSFWPVPKGELTNIGKNQHLTFGKWLRNRYNGFLSPEYNKSEIHVRSSDTDRCFMSAASNLAGLYPPKGKDIWKDDLNWQPIPIHTIPLEKDDIAEIGSSCPKYDEVKSAAEELPFFRDINEKNKQLYEFLTEKTGKNVTEIGIANEIHDTLFIEKLYNLTLPDWAIEVYPQLQEIGDINPKLFAYTPELARLFVGRLFDEILSQFNSFVQKNLSFLSSVNQKFKVFSGHDDQVFSILNALNVQNLKKVPYASAVIFELKKSEGGQVYVQVLYKTKETYADLVQIGDCDLLCDFAKFVDIMKPISITEKEFMKECKK